MNWWFWNQSEERDGGQKMGGYMSEKELFEKMYRLTKQLKGAPLRDFEKQALIDEFNKASGAVFEKVKTAIANILHGNPSYIFEKGDALPDVDRLIKEVRRAAENLENSKQRTESG
jgi:hypothetical protein